MARIEFRRPRSYASSLRRIGIYLDGRSTLWLEPGDSEGLDVIPGEHVVQAFLDWTTSAPVALQLQEGQTVRLNVGPGRVRDWFIRPSKALELSAEDRR